MSGDVPGGARSGGAEPRGDTDSAGAAASRGSWQQRFEESRPGRRLITGFLTVTIASILVWNLPESALRETLRPIVAPFLTTVGLDQGWRLFSPSPRQRSEELYARIEFADGSDVTWNLPGGDLIGSYRSYRWRKWAAEVRRDRREELWDPAARYVGRLHTSAGMTPTRVTLIRRWADVPEPGSGQPAQWEEYAFYTVELGGRAAGASGGG